MGGYEDLYADFGRLSGEIWRAVRLVVDTGIHAKGWTQEEAVQYALENSPRPEPSVQSEIRRYFNNPGQATAYKIGMLRIQAIRAKARPPWARNSTFATSTTRSRFRSAAHGDARSKDRRLGCGAALSTYLQAAVAECLGRVQ
jgi:hypothetical protein